MSPKNKAARRNYKAELAYAQAQLAEVKQGLGLRDFLRVRAALLDEIRRRAGRPTVAEERAALKRLGLSHAILTVGAVHRAYRRLATQAHPDGGGSADAFIRLTADRDLVVALALRRRGAR